MKTQYLGDCRASYIAAGTYPSKIKVWEYGEYSYVVGRVYDADIGGNVHQHRVYDDIDDALTWASIFCKEFDYAPS